MDHNESSLSGVADYGNANTPLAVAFARHLFLTQPPGMIIEQYIQSLRSYIMTEADGHLSFNGGAYWKGRFLGEQARHEATLDRFGATYQSSPWNDEELQRSAIRRSIARRDDQHSLPSPPATEEAFVVQDVQISAALRDTTTAGKLRRSIVVLRASMGAVPGRRDDTVKDRSQALLAACKDLEYGFEVLIKTAESGTKQKLAQLTRLMTLLAQQVASSATALLAIPAPRSRRQRHAQASPVPAAVCRAAQAGLHTLQRISDLWFESSPRKASERTLQAASEASADVAAVLRSLVVPIYPRDLPSSLSNTQPATQPTDDLRNLRELLLCTLLAHTASIIKRQMNDHNDDPSSERARALSLQSQYIFPLARYASERMPQELRSTGQSGQMLQRARASFQGMLWNDLMGEGLVHALEGDVLSFPTLDEVAEAVEQDIARSRDEPSWLLAQMDDLLGIEAGWDYQGRQSKDDWLTLKDVEKDLEEEA